MWIRNERIRLVVPPEDMDEAEFLYAVHEAITAAGALHDVAEAIGRRKGWKVVPNDWARTVERWKANTLKKLDPSHPFGWHHLDHCDVARVLGCDPLEYQAPRALKVAA